MTILWEVIVLCTNSDALEASAQYREIAAATRSIAVTVTLAVAAMEIEDETTRQPFPQYLRDRRMRTQIAWLVDIL